MLVEMVGWLALTGVMARAAWLVGHPTRRSLRH